MQVNTEVYGARSTWRRDEGGFSWFNANIPDDMQFKRGQYNRLIDYVNNNKMSFGQHIDYSICYAAHGEGMPLASVRTWYTPYEGGQWKAYTYKRNKVTGWFFGHQLDNYNNYAFYIRNPKALLVDGVTNSHTNSDLWLPNGVNANYPEQQSKLIAPIVEFPTRGAYFGIEVCLYKASSASFYRKPLSELQTGDWSEYIIVAAYGILYTYANNERDYQMNDGRCCVCPNETYEFEREDTHQKGLPFLKYCQFNGMSSSVLPIFGWVDGGANSEYFGGRNHAVKRMFWNGTDSDGYSQIFIDTVPNAIFNALDFSDWGKAIEAYCTVTAENLEAIRKAAAAYGLFFTEQNPDNLRTNANRWTNSAMFCGVLDENGVGHGEYTQGEGNRDNPVYNMGSSQNSNYDPTTPPTPVDPNTYSNTTGFNAISLGASMTMRYVLNSANIDKLADDLWTICAALAVDSGEIDYTYFEDKVIDNFLVTSPIESIISLKRFPFNVPYISPQEKSAVKLGKNTGSAEGYLTNFVFNTIVFSGVDIYPRFGNSFLDYEPYTSYEVYIPFCGTVKIRAADILGHTLNVTLQIDLSTGTCTAFIMADSLVIETVTGACGVDLQVTGTDTTAVNSAIVSSITRARNAKTQEKEVISSTFTPTGLFSAILNPIGKAHQYSMAEESLTQASYELSHISVPMHSMSAASPLLGWIQEFDARIMIYYPEGSVIDNNAPPTAPSLNAAALAEFGSLKGFATVSPGIASEFHGYTQGTIIPDNIPCTESERNRIKQAFSAGVFLP